MQGRVAAWPLYHRCRPRAHGFLVPETAGKHDLSSCCTAVIRVLANGRFSWAEGDAPASSPKIEVPLEFQGLGAHRRRRCRAGGIARKKRDVAGENAMVSGMAGR